MTWPDHAERPTAPTPVRAGLQVWSDDNLSLVHDVDLTISEDRQ
ncbi:hypothetical protein ACFWSJ_34910 [Streptomyces niveus]